MSASLLGSYGCVEQRVDALAADLLVAAQQALAPVSRGLSCSYRAGVPRLDVQLDAVQLRDGPGESSEGCEGLPGETVPAMARRDTVAGRGTPIRDLRQPQSRLAEGFVGGPVGNAKGVSVAGGEPTLLPFDVGEGFVMIDVSVQRAGHWDIGVRREIHDHVRVTLVKGTQVHLGEGRPNRGPRRQTGNHALILPRLPSDRDVVSARIRTQLAAARAESRSRPAWPHEGWHQHADMAVRPVSLPQVVCNLSDVRILRAGGGGGDLCEKVLQPRVIEEHREATKLLPLVGGIAEEGVEHGCR